MSSALYLLLVIGRVTFFVIYMSFLLLQAFCVHVAAPALRAIWRWTQDVAGVAASHPVHRPAPPTHQDRPRPVERWSPNPALPATTSTSRFEPSDDVAFDSVLSAFNDHGAKSVTVPDPEAALAPRVVGREPRIPPWVEFLRRADYRVIWTENSSMNCPAWVVTRIDSSGSRWDR